MVLYEYVAHEPKSLKREKNNKLSAFDTRELISEEIHSLG